MRSQIGLSHIKFIVIDNQNNTIPAGLDAASLSISLFDHIPRDLKQYIEVQPTIIITTQETICRALISQALNCPIYILLETVSSASIAAAFEAGASDYLSTPIQLAELRARIAQQFPQTSETHKSIQELATIIDHTPIAIAMFDTTMHYLHANAAWKTSYKLEDIELIGQSHYDIFPEIGDDWKAIHQRCLAGEIDTSEVAPFPREDGTMDWVSWEVRPWYKEGAEVGGLLMYTEVITDKVVAKQAHQEAEARYSEMIENASDAVFITQNDRIIYANLSAHRLLGYAQGEIDKQLFWQHIAPEHLERMQKAFVQYHGEDEPSEWREIQVITAKGDPVDVELSMSPTAYNQMPGTAIFMRDITERKLAELVVSETQDRLQAQAESLITINQIADSLHQVLDVNELAKTAVDACKRYLDADISVFYITDIEKEVFKLIVADGASDTLRRVSDNLPFEGTLTGALLKEKKIIISEELADDDRLYAGSKTELARDFSQIIFIPALHNQKVLGAMNLGFRSTRHIDGETLTTLQAIGQTLGLALSNARTVELLIQEIQERQATDSALRLSEERLKSVITTVPVILFAVDNEGIFTLSTGRGLELIGLKDGEALGQSVYDLYASNPRTIAIIEDALAGNKGHRQLESNNKIFDVYYSPLDNGAGATGVCIDVTERMRAQRLQDILFRISRATSEAGSLHTLLQIVQGELSQLLDTSNFYVALHDAETGLYSFPYWQDELVNASELWHPQALENSLTEYVRTTGEALIVDQEKHEQMRRDGLVNYNDDTSMSWLGVPLKTSNRIIGVMAIQSYSNPQAYDWHDLEFMSFVGDNIAWVIESKQSELALQKSEETAREAQKLLQLVLNTIPISVFWKDRELVFLGCNQIFAEDLGYRSPQAIIGKDDYDLSTNKEDVEKYREDDREVMERGLAKLQYEETGTQLDGGIRWLETSKIPMRNASGDIVGILGTFIDITDRKEAALALQKSEAIARELQTKFQQLHEISFELTAINSLDDVYRRAVELGRDKLGYDRIALFLVDIEADSILGTFGTDSTGQIRDERAMQYPLSDDPKVSRIMTEGWDTYLFMDAVLTDNWEKIGQGWNGMSTLWDGSTGIGIIAVDNLLSQQPPRPYERDLLTMFGAVLGYVISGKQSDAARQQMVEQLQLLNDIDQAILATVSPRGIAQAVVHQLNELMNGDYASIISLNEAKKEYEILAWTTETDIPYTVPFSFANDILENESLRSGIRYDVPDLDSIDPISPAEQRLYEKGIRSYSILPLLTDHELVGVLTVGLNKSGGFSQEKLIIVHGIATQLALAFRQAMLLERVQDYATDLEQLVQERTAQLTAKANELEAFTYSVSHDLRSPLRAISGFAEVVLEDFEGQLDKDAGYYLERIRHNANRMGTLIDDLLRLSRVGRRDLETRTVKPNNIVQAIIEELRADEQLGVARITVDDLPECDADPTLLKQLWFNLIINAVKYSQMRDEPLITIGATQQNGETVYFIRDNGIGFDMQFADKLFGVFQRLHEIPDYEGTGIGLATVYRIVERHQGRVWAEATPDEGASFFFTIGI